MVCQPIGSIISIRVRWIYNLMKNMFYLRNVRSVLPYNACRTKQLEAQLLVTPFVTGFWRVTHYILTSEDDTSRDVKVWNNYKQIKQEKSDKYIDVFGVTLFIYLGVYLFLFTLINYKIETKLSFTIYMCSTRFLVGYTSLY